MSDTAQKEKKKIPEAVPIYVQNLIENGAPIDRGWAWVICFAGFLLHIHVSGLTRISGLILNELFIEFERNKAETSLTLTILYITSIAAAPLANWLSQKTSHRLVIFIGGLSTSFGIGISSFAPSLPVFTILFSLFVGCGCGFIYTPSIAVVSQYFYRYRSLAVGLSMSGSGLGAFLIPPLVSYLNTHYTFRGMLLILSGVYLQVLVSASLMRPFRYFTRHAASNAPLVEKTTLKKVKKSMRFWQRPLFRNPHLYITGLAMAVLTEGLMMSYMLIPPMGLDNGLSLQQLTTLLIVMGVPDFLGRTGFGWFADKGFIPRWMLVSILGCVEVILFFCVTFNITFVTMILFAITMGAVGGAIAALLGPVIADAVGIANIGTGLGVMMVAKLIAFPIPVLLGAVRDATGKWVWSSRVLAIILLAASIFLLLTKCVKDPNVERTRKPDLNNIEIEMDEIEGDDLIRRSSSQRARSLK